MNSYVKNEFIEHQELSLNMHIFVKMLDDITLTFEVESDDKVKSLKEQIFDKIRSRDNREISICDQRLIYRGQSLNDAYSLQDYDISLHDTLHLVLNLRGG